MEWGRLLEPVLVKRFEAETGYKVIINKERMFHDELKYISGETDGFVGDSAILEVKTTSMDRDWQDDQIPLYYQYQTQLYMHLAKRQKCYFAVLVKGSRFFVRELDYDKDMASECIGVAQRFWEDHVVPKIPPAYSEEEAAKIFPKATKKECKLPDDSLSIMEKYLKYKAVESEAKSKAEDLKFRLQSMLKEHETGFNKNYVVKWKNVKSNRLNSSRLKAERPEIFREYVEQTQSRRFLVSFNEEKEE